MDALYVIHNIGDKTLGKAFTSFIFQLTGNEFRAIMDSVPRGSESSKPGER